MDFLTKAKAEVIVDIGQIDAASRKALARAARLGQIDKWRGHWFPVAGAGYGLGPVKTCYGPVGSRAALVTA